MWKECIKRKSLLFILQDLFSVEISLSSINLDESINEIKLIMGYILWSLRNAMHPREKIWMEEIYLILKKSSFNRSTVVVRSQYSVSLYCPLNRTHTSLWCFHCFILTLETPLPYSLLILTCFWQDNFSWLLGVVTLEGQKKLSQCEIPHKIIKCLVGRIGKIIL